MIRNQRLVWHSCEIQIQLRNKINGELLVLSPRYVAPEPIIGCSDNSKAASVNPEAAFCLCIKPTVYVAP